MKGNRGEVRLGLEVRGRGKITETRRLSEESMKQAGVWTTESTTLQFLTRAPISAADFQYRLITKPRILHQFWSYLLPLRPRPKA